MTVAAASRERVGLFLPTLGGGGAERVTLNLARGLLAAGVDVDLVAASAKGAYKDTVPEGARLVDLGAGRVLSSFPSLRRYLRSERPTAFLSALNHANVMALWAARAAGYPGRVVVVEHNDVLEAGRGSVVEGRVLPWLMRRTYPRAGAVVAVSEGVKRSLVVGVGLPAAKVEVIYNPVLTEATARAAKEPAEHEFFERRGVPVVVGVGRLTRQKNFANLLRAFAELRATTEASLIVLGEGEERPALERLAAELGVASDVSMPGFVANPHAFLARADLFVLSSDFEGLPTVLIEALAAGGKVVSTDCPSGPSEILDGGRYGALVPVGDSSALAQAMAQALGRPSPELGGWLEQFGLVHATRAYMTALGVRGTFPADAQRPARE